MKTILTILLLTNIALAENYPNPTFFYKEVIGKYGTEWKPNRKFVKIKLTSAVVRDFNLGCYVVTKTGDNEYLDYVRTDSRGRRMYKTSFSCENYRSAKIICEEDKQTVTFKSRKNVCSKIK